MKKSILMGVSVLAMMAAIPALAETVKTETGAAVKVEGPQNAKAGTEKNLEKTGQAIEEAAEDLSDSVDQAYRDMRTFFQGETGPKDLATINIEASQTAEGMIGQSVQGTDGKRVGKVEDIILDKNGNAEMVIVSEGGILGLGDRLAAFDYDVVTAQNQEGDVLSTLTNDKVKQVAEFSYDQKDASDKVRVLPAGGYSTKKILEANLVDPKNSTVADVENVVFRNGQAEYLIAAFNQVLGLGGEKAVMNYDELSLVQDEGDIRFRLSAEQTAKFEKFKDTKASN